MKWGYIRISTEEQSEIRQLESLIAAGVPEENIFIDKMSGKNFNRPAYQKLKKKVQPGHTIVFHELDRLGRNFKEGKAEVDYFKDNNIKLVFLDMDFLSSMSDSDDIFVQLMGYVQVLTYLAIAEKEREKIKKRQREGIEIAKRNGVYTGRVKKYHTKNKSMNHAIKLYQEKKHTVKEICEITGISRAALYRRLKELEDLEGTN